MLIVVSVYKKIFYSTAERKVLLLNAHLLWIYGWVMFNTGRAEKIYQGIHFTTLGLPKIIETALFIFICMTTAAIVFLMMSFLFRSLLWGLLCMVPLTITIIILYGIIGFIGKDYDMPVVARFQGTEAKWHGTSQHVVDVPDALSGVLGVASAILGAFNVQCSDEEEECEDEEGMVNRGMVRALSLMIRVENAIGADLHTGWGGIGVAQMVDSDGEPFDVPVLPDADRNREAVLIALEGLVRRR